MNYLLDTCLLSELYRLNPDSGVVRWIEGIDEQRLFVASLSLGEIQKGITQLEEGVRRTRIQDWLDQDLMGRFAQRILSLDGEVALEWGALLGESVRRGQVLPVVDSMIAAIAVVHNLTVVTRNTKDFERIQVRLLNPWE